MTSTALSQPQPLILWNGKYCKEEKSLVNIFFYLNPGEEINPENSYPCFHRMSRRRKRVQKIEVLGSSIINAKKGK